jgi:hypothetical protein
MKRISIVFCVLVLIFSSISCGALTGTGALYTDITKPEALGHMTTYQVTPESDYESIAFVEGVSKGTVILGLIATGNFGYGAAIEDALSKAPGATRLIDITVDTQIKSFLGVYAEFITKVRGRAVKLRKK